MTLKGDNTILQLFQQIQDVQHKRGMLFPTTPANVALWFRIKMKSRWSVFKLHFFIRRREWKTLRSSGTWVLHHMILTSLPHLCQILWLRALTSFAPSNQTVWITMYLHNFQQTLFLRSLVAHLYCYTSGEFQDTYSHSFDPGLSHRFSHLIHCRFMYTAVQEIIQNL